MLFLQSHDVSARPMPPRFSRPTGSESIDVVKENPYRLADDIWGIGFKTADTIAEKMGIRKGDVMSVCAAAFLYTLNKLSEEGHCYAFREQLIETSASRSSRR